MLACHPPQQHDTGEKGEHGGPAEPPQGARGELCHHIGLARIIGFLDVFGLYEVEVVQQSNPGHAENNMGVAEEYIEKVCHLFPSRAC